MKCIQHSRHGMIFRMPNEDAHLLVSSGRYVYVSKFEARDAALSPRRSWLARIGMFVAAALAVMALLMLTTSAQAAKLECLTTQSQAAKIYPGKHLKYREINGSKCWYAGRTRAKSEFSLPATASSRGGLVRGASQPSPKRQDANGFAPILTAVSPAPRETNHADEAFGPSTDSGQNVHEHAKASASRRGEPAPDDPHRTAYSVTFEHDAILAACGMPCPHDQSFDQIWNARIR
jgi:hypothetical protein